MKQMSLWAIAIVSALFVIMVVIEQHNWELLIEYTGVMAAWMFLGWYRVHWDDFKYDLRLMSNLESPFKFRWVGTFVALGLMVVLVIALVVGALFFIVSQALKLI